MTFFFIFLQVLIFYSSVHFVHSHPTPSAKHDGMSFKFSHVQPTKEATEDPVNSTRNRNHHNLNSLRKLEQKEQQIPSDRIKRNATESMKDELVSSTRRANGSATDVRGRNYLNRSSVRSRVSWQSFRGRRQVTHSCVKRTVKTYHAALDEIVTEYECWKSSFYCDQTSSGLYRCEPVMTFHAGLDKTLTVGCRCKPWFEFIVVRTLSYAITRYRKRSIKRRGTYFIFPVIGAVLIRERRLFQLRVKHWGNYREN